MTKIKSGKIYKVYTKGWTRERWLQYRSCGIGASEIGTLLGLSPYKSKAHLFYEKIGEELPQEKESLPSFLGRQQEPFLAKMWQYWDPANPTETAMIANFEAKRIMRRSRKVNAYVHNRDYPHLFVSLDREILPNATLGKYIMIVHEPGALELKTIGGWEADKWESGIPPAYIAQVNQQMLVLGYKYGEIPILKDNREFFVYPFERNETIIEAIIDASFPFWETVLQARQFKAQETAYINAGERSAAEDMRGEIQRLEPGPEGSDAYASFLKEKYRIAEPGIIKGTADMLDAGYKHQRLKGKMEALKSEALIHENILKNFMGQNNAEKIDFGAGGYISWKNNANGSRVFLNKVRELEGGMLPDIDISADIPDGDGFVI